MAVQSKKNKPGRPFGQRGAVSAEARAIAERSRLQRQLQAMPPSSAR